MKTTRKFHRRASPHFGVVGRACALAAILGVSCGVSMGAEIFSVDHENLPAAGTAVTEWDVFDKTQGNPVVVELAGEKWYPNSRGEDTRLTHNSGNYAAGTNIPINGATIVTAVMPVRHPDGQGWNSIVDIFYDQLCMGIHNVTGEVKVKVNGASGANSTWTGGVIPEYERGVLTLVVGPEANPAFEVFWRAEGEAAAVSMGTGNGNTGGEPYTALYAQANGRGYAGYMNIGRNNPDGWSTYNGFIGDTYVYDEQLSEVDRVAVQDAVYAAMNLDEALLSHTITASGGTGGTIDPEGAITVLEGNDQTFDITTDYGYELDQVLVDGVNDPQAVIDSTYTFPNVTEDHTIAVTWTALTTHTITATGGTGGTIDPEGAIVRVEGDDQTFNITTDFGYALTQVLVDGVNDPQAVIDSTYTFSNVLTDHTIAVTWTELLSVAGTVTESVGSTPLLSAVVYVSSNPDGSNPTASIEVDVNGDYQIPAPNANGTNYVIARKGGYSQEIKTVVMAGSSVVDEDFVLVPTTDLVPLVDLDASALSDGALTSWPNTGYLGGSFDSVDGTPTVTEVGGMKAVLFDDGTKQTLAGTVPSPPEISGASDWTISTDLYRDDMGGNEQVYMCWSGRNAAGGGGTAQFGYRTTGNCVIHWGADFGFESVVPSAGEWHNVTITYDGADEIMYVDGAESSTRNWTLNHKPGSLMLVGDAYYNDDPDTNHNRYDGAIGSLRIYDKALTAAEVESISGSSNPYDTWATGGEPFDGDANGDGVDDGLAWILGAADPAANALGKLPVASEDGSFLILNFERVNPYAPAKLYVEYGNDLTGWTPEEITVAETKASGVVVEVTTGTPDSVTVKIPTSLESASGALFARLVAEE